MSLYSIYHKKRSDNSRAPNGTVDNRKFVQRFRFFKKKQCATVSTLDAFVFRSFIVSTTHLITWLGH